jgi:uncharacterized protein YyaL (SSP411 family)
MVFEIQGAERPLVARGFSNVEQLILNQAGWPDDNG